MRHARLASLALISCCSLACPSTPSEPGATVEQKQPSPDKPPAEPSKPEPSEQTSAGEHAPKPKPDEATKLRKRLLALLNEGRAATKKGDYQTGMAKYREALEIDASDVAVLGELGWAAYKAGDLELAHRTTVQALKFVNEDKQRGMLLYNLGRIAEDREQISDAVDHYRASLAVRPGNEPTQQRLDATLAVQQNMAIAGSAGGELEGPEPAGLEVLARDLADLTAACEIIETQRCEDYTMFEGEVCSCDPKLLATPGADESWGLVKLQGDAMERQVAWFPVVKTDKGWTVFTAVLYTYNPGAFGIFEEEQIHPSSIETLLDKGTQLVMRVSKSRFDRDMGLNEVSTEDHYATIVCARHETGAYCTRPLITSYRYAREVEFPEQDLEIAGAEVEHQGLPFEAGFSADVEFVAGKLIVKWTKVMGEFNPSGEGDVWSTAGGRILRAGEHSLAALLGLPN